MTNAFIGLMRGDSRLPDTFHKHGFQDRAIELRFSIGDGKVVHPELIATSELLDHCLLFEWKSGKNIESGQAARYAALDSSMLRRAASLPVRGTSTFDIVYVGEDSHAATLTLGLQSASVTFPLLTKGVSTLGLAANTFSSTALQREFAQPVSIDWERVTTQFVPLDGESERWEVAEAAWPHILAAMGRRDPELEVGTLASQIFPTWSILRDAGRESVLALLKQVLKDASEHEFKGIYSLERATGVQRDAKLRFVKNPLRLGHKNQQEYAELRQRQRKLLRVLQEKDARQLNLFD